MRFLGVSLAFAVTLFSSATASAATLSASGQINITAKVADTHYVVVDEKNNIIEITSNTKRDVVPRIYMGNISVDSEIPLTQEIFTAYRSLVPIGQSHIGVLYKQAVFPDSSDRWFSHFFKNAPQAGSEQALLDILISEQRTIFLQN